MKLTGKVTEVLPLIQVGQNNTTKGGFIIQISDGNKTKHVAFNTWGKFAQDLILKTGNCVEVDFNVESRKWKDKWFTEATAFTVKNVVDENFNTHAQQRQTATPNKDSDLPF